VEPTSDFRYGGHQDAYRGYAETAFAVEARFSLLGRNCFMPIPRPTDSKQGNRITRSIQSMDNATPRVKGSSPEQRLDLDAGCNPHQVFTIGAASSLVESAPLVLKYGDAFGVFDKNGDVSVGHATAQGLYYRDTRHLSAFSITLYAARPILLSSNLRDDNATVTCDLSNPDLYDGEGQLRLEHDRLHLRRSRFLWNAACFERLNICNFDDRPHRIVLGISFSVDFADLFEVRGARRERRGQTLAPKLTSSEVILGYLGLDHRRRTTTLRFDPEPQSRRLSPAGIEVGVGAGARRGAGRAPV
jgi:hypothetical protein